MGWVAGAIALHATYRGSLTPGDEVAIPEEPVYVRIDDTAKILAANRIGLWLLSAVAADLLAMLLLGVST